MGLPSLRNGHRPDSELATPACANRGPLPHPTVRGRPDDRVQLEDRAFFVQWQYVSPMDFDLTDEQRDMINAIMTLPLDPRSSLPQPSR